MTEPTSSYLTAEQIADELGVHISTVRRHFRNGLPGRKVGHHWTTTRAAFDAWLLRQPEQPAASRPAPLETKRP